ncbi:MAG: ABC transporter permease [Microbacteriaceae bacterium]|nr:ABC transporter permease [Microbacteriaceae bacterium]MCL2793820.1 ABC transporter permease [Microbacteriaceae bacterium]
MSVTTYAPTRAAAAARTKPKGSLRRLVWTEAKVWMRSTDPFWALLFPTVLIVGQTLVAPALREVATGDTWAGTPFYGVAVVNIILPAMLAMAIATTALTILPATFGAFREKGVLRRFSATPMRPQSLFLAHFIINTVMSFVGALIAVVVTSALFPIAMPVNIAMVVLGFALGMAAMMSLGSLLAAWVPRAAIASTVGMLVFFPLLLTAGVFTVVEPGTVLYEIARVTPLGAASQVMSYGWFGGDVFPWVQIIAMVAWTAVLTPLAVKLFRWK